VDRENLITTLIRLARSPGGDAHRRALVDRVAGGDHALPVAREWVRRWGPRPMVVTPPPCACATGRCTVCN